MKQFRPTARLVVSVVAVVMSATAALAQSSANQAGSKGAGTKENTASNAASVGHYMQMHAVLRHPRCVNCHPRDDTPKQGLDQHIHSPPITRGPQDRGPLGQPCSSCHTRPTTIQAGCLAPSTGIWCLPQWRGKANRQPSYVAQ